MRFHLPGFPPLILYGENLGNNLVYVVVWERITLVCFWSTNKLHLTEINYSFKWTDLSRQLCFLKSSAVKLEIYPEVTKFSLASHGKWNAMKLTNYFLFCIHCHRFGWGYATENFEHYFICHQPASPLQFLVKDFTSFVVLTCRVKMATKFTEEVIWILLQT